MARIELDGVSLTFRVRQDSKGLTWKDWVLGLVRRRARPHIEIRALQDVSFEVSRGERVGIVGHKGAGADAGDDGQGASVRDGQSRSGFAAEAMRSAGLDGSRPRAPYGAQRRDHRGLPRVRAASAAAGGLKRNLPLAA